VIRRLKTILKGKQYLGEIERWLCCSLAIGLPRSAIIETDMAWINTSVVVEFWVIVTGGGAVQYLDSVKVVVMMLGGGIAQYSDAVTVVVLVSVTGGGADCVSVSVHVLVTVTIDKLETGGGTLYPPDGDSETVVISVLVE
jgi:hypothetical protein